MLCIVVVLTTLLIAGCRTASRDEEVRDHDASNARHSGAMAWGIAIVFPYYETVLLHKRTWVFMELLLPLLLGCAVLTGCGASSEPLCNNINFTLSAGPANANAPGPNHMDSPPGNQEKFQAMATPAPGLSCVSPAHIAVVSASWSVSDTVHVQISIAADATNGLTTCVGVTATPATTTATVTQSGITRTATTSISCK